jgi:hypothetical protein
VEVSLNPPVESGAYVPSITGVYNIAGSSATACQFLRVGNTVTVSGSVEVNASSASTLTRFRISLPITSDLSAIGQCAGTACCQVANEPGLIFSDTSNERALLDYYPTSAGDQDLFFTFTYRVI